MLNDLYPLLTTVQPAQLNMTLNALSTALEGRGDELGENLETIDAYLKRINPQIPGLVEDLRLTAQVSDTYADVLPEVAQILDNTITTGQTLEGREAQLHALFTRHRVVLRHRAHVPRRQRRRAGAARQGQRRPAAGAGALLHRVPVPDPGPGQRRQAARPRRSAGSCCTSSWRLLPRQPRAYKAQRQAAHRGQPRPQLPAPAEPALEPVQPREAPAQLQRRRRRRRPARAPRGSPLR